METPPGANVPWAPWNDQEPPAEPDDNNTCDRCGAQTFSELPWCAACEVIVDRRRMDRYHRKMDRLFGTEEVPW